jgi:hypothetical protein
MPSPHASHGTGDEPGSSSRLNAPQLEHVQRGAHLWAVRFFGPEWLKQVEVVPHGSILSLRSDLSPVASATGPHQRAHLRAYSLNRRETFDLSLDRSKFGDGQLAAVEHWLGFGKRRAATN